MSNLELSWCLTSAGPDCVADFGCDANGKHVIMEDSYDVHKTSTVKEKAIGVL